MPDQRHRIKRQVLEVVIQQEARAQDMQRQLSRIYRTRLVPMIDRLCSQASDPGCLHRIDSLEVDLGTLDGDNLEDELVARLSRQLPRLLAASIGQTESTEPGADGVNMLIRSRLELLAQFARTGSLPWWADATQPRLLHETLRALIQQAPAMLAELMRELVMEPNALRRMAQHYDDRLLAELIRVVVPAAQSSLAAFSTALVGLLPRLDITFGKTRNDIREGAWHALLFTAVLRGEQTKTALGFGREVFLQIAGRWRVDYARLLMSVGRAIEPQEARINGPLADIVRALHSEVDGQPGSHADAAARQLDRLLDRLQRVAGPLSPVVAELRPCVALPPTLSRADLSAALSQLVGHGTDSTAAAPQAVALLLRWAIEHQLLPPGAVQRCVAALGDLDSAALPPSFRDELSRLLAPSGREAGVFPTSQPVAHRFVDGERVADSDQLYVSNAGLVILWPFLGHLFQHLGLLADNRFSDDAAVQRAVGLLGYLATEDPSPPEYLLPLCKALCGMALQDVFDFGPPVSEQEAVHCANLLQAVIAQAPILGQMSSAGFRGSFLLRQGALSTVESVWLLRVERETYDIVLDRFPWGFEWIKLPWMEKAMRVEW